MTEARVFTFMTGLLAFLTVLCILTGQWFGVIGSALGTLSALSARWLLLQWKPTSATE